MKRLVAGLVFVLMTVLFSSCGSVEKSTVADKPVQDFQMKLLDLAFDGVSEMPLRPHIKNRSRAQQALVSACIELGQPTCTLEYVEQIANWRRWMGTADLAFYLAENGYNEQARDLIGQVQSALTMAEDLREGRIVAATPNAAIDTLEDWRYRAVLSRVAEVRLLNGTVDSVDADEEKYGEVNASSLMMGVLSDGAESFEDTLNVLRVVTEDPNFEIVHLGLLEMAGLVGKNYDRVSFSRFVAENVSPKLNRQMPVFLQMDVLLHFADSALKNSDAASALLLLEQVKEMAGKLKSSPRIYIPEKAKLVQAMYKAGQLEDAEAGLLSMISVFDEKHDFIVNIERAELLCRIAETAECLGQREQALALYRRAVAEGQVNPNSRPQAEDLGRICSSMALHGIEPTRELWGDLNAMKDGLGEPW